MVRFVMGDADGKNRVVVLGLSDGNLELLRRGMPIVVKGAELGLGEFDVCIVWGPTEQKIVDDLNTWAASRGIAVPPVENLHPQAKG